MSGYECRAPSQDGCYLFKVPATDRCSTYSEDYYLPEGDNFPVSDLLELMYSQDGDPTPEPHLSVCFNEQSAATGFASRLQIRGDPAVR